MPVATLRAVNPGNPSLKAGETVLVPRSVNMSAQAVAAQFARVAPVPTPVPTLSPWGVLLLALGLSLFGLQRLPIKRWQL